METNNIDIFKCLDYLRDNAVLYAEAKSNRVAAEEKRKAIKAIVMKQYIDLPVAAQEREAYASEEYRKAIDELRQWVYEETMIASMLEAARMKIEIYRTLQANNRIERSTI